MIENWVFLLNNDDDADDDVDLNIWWSNNNLTD